MRPAVPRADRRRSLPRAVVLCAAPVAVASVVGMLGLLAPAMPASGTSADTATATVWLCRPGMPNDPCASSLTTTVVTHTGQRTVETPTDASNPPVDCFYVYPTASRQKTPNSNLRIQPAETVVATAQAAPFSQVCKVWAPMYRQETLTELGGPGFTINDDKTAENIAYQSVLSAWKDYLANDNHGRPFVLIGHSQGAAMLIRLVVHQIDPNPKLRARLVSAIILGGNVQVPTGKVVGGTFKHVGGCVRPTQVHCVIAYSSFATDPPTASLFGRPGQGVSLQSTQTSTAGQVLCTNPAALAGGTAPLTTAFPADGVSIDGQPVTTPWVTYPARYTAGCRHADGATWLQVSAAPDDPRPVVTATPSAIWGLHGFDVNLAVGNLVDDVRLESATFGH